MESHSQKPTCDFPHLQNRVMISKKAYAHIQFKLWSVYYMFLYVGTWCQLHPEGYTNFEYDIYQDTLST